MMKINYTTTTNAPIVQKCEICGTAIPVGSMVHEVPVKGELKIVCAACLEIARGDY